jgi:hypothetical protein
METGSGRKSRILSDSDHKKYFLRQIRNESDC